MKKNIFIIAIAALTLSMVACKPKAIEPTSLYVSETEISKITSDGVVYNLNDFIEKYMTEEGNYKSDSSLYRTRATNGDGIYLFSIDTIPTNGEGIYIRGRICTDDYSGNFYKSMVIQQWANGEQQALRISIDAGNANGLYAYGQEILIRCNGLAIGRYADQPQLCVPTYNNNRNANKFAEKVGWAPGRIPAERFAKVVTRIGQPDQSKVKAEKLNIADLSSMITTDDQATYRKWDGKLVYVENVYFTGQYDYYGTPTDCTTGDPATDGNANVFAPTTNNMGYPQGRIISDGTNLTLVSTSEYAKFARYYLPDDESKGTITGILGYYRDNAKNATDKYDWSITIRFWPSDIDLKEWTPKEYSN